MDVGGGLGKRDLRAGDILDEGVALYKKNFQFLFGVSIIGNLTTLVLQIFVYWPVWAAQEHERLLSRFGFNLPYNLSEYGGQYLFPDGYDPWRLTAMILFGILFIYTRFVIIRSADTVMKGDHEGIGRIYFSSLKYFPKALWVSFGMVISLFIIIFAIMMAVSFPLIIIVAILTALYAPLGTVAGILFFLLLCLQFISFSGWYHLSLVTYVRERTGAIATITKTGSMIFRNFLKIIAVSATCAVIFYSVYYIPLGIMSLISYFAGIENPIGLVPTGLTSNIVSLVLSRITGSLAFPLTYCSLVVLHDFLKKMREGRGIYDKAAEIFGI